MGKGQLHMLDIGDVDTLELPPQMLMMPYDDADDAARCGRRHISLMNMMTPAAI